MPKIILTNLEDMKPERFEQLWREAVEGASPVDELVETTNTSATKAASRLTWLTY